MATVSKIIIKNQGNKYEWTQTDEAITVNLPMKNVLMK
jgi:hypothetical protein